MHILEFEAQHERAREARAQSDSGLDLNVDLQDPILTLIRRM
jgi:hypothetical protein